MGEKKSGSLEMGNLAGLEGGDLGILRNEGGGFEFEKKVEKETQRKSKRGKNLPEICADESG